MKLWPFSDRESISKSMGHEKDKMIRQAEKDGLPVQVSEKGSVIVGGVNENVCERCGGPYQRRTMWFSGESAPPRLSWDYCTPCIKIVEFEKRNIFQAPFQYPQRRPKNSAPQ